MKFEELLTFISMKGTILDHNRRIDPFNPVSDFYMLRFEWANKCANIKYHKDPLTNEVTFVHGTIIVDTELGLHDEEVWGFKHLEKQLT